MNVNVRLPQVAIDREVIRTELLAYRWDGEPYRMDPNQTWLSASIRDLIDDLMTIIQDTDMYGPDRVSCRWVAEPEGVVYGAMVTVALPAGRLVDLTHSGHIPVYDLTVDKGAVGLALAISIVEAVGKHAASVVDRLREIAGAP